MGRAVVDRNRFRGQHYRDIATSLSNWNVCPDLRISATLYSQGILMKRCAHFLAIAVLTASAHAQFKATPLTGTWSVTEIKTTGPKARTISHPQPGLLIFTGDHYSLMIIESDQPRAEVQNPQIKKPTADELLAAWEPFTAAAGTYEISGNTLTTRPSVAKNPQVMAPGNVQLNTFKIDKKILTLTRIRNGETPVANPTTITFTKVE